MSNVSFTIRRPTPVSRASSTTPAPAVDAAAFKTPAVPSPLARSAASTPPTTANNDGDDDDSSGAESPAADELVTGFDRFGVQRCVAPLRPTAVVSTHSSP